MMTNTFPRLRISGTITNKTDLMIGSGLEIRNPANQQDDSSPTYTAICLGADKKPYIPASSLRGLLLSLCKKCYPNSPLIHQLFGNGKQAVNPDEPATGNSRMGALRIYDAICDIPFLPEKPTVRTSNAIDPSYGTAKDNMLYSHAYVPEGASFTSQIEADNLNQTEIEQLLGLLAQLKESPFSQLGKGQSRQQGLITWQQTKVEAITEEALINWLLDKNSLKLSLPEKTFTPQEPPCKPKLNRLFKLKLVPQSPILINDPERISVSKNKQNQEKNRQNEAEKGQVDFAFRRNRQDQLIIPASSLKGVMRSHCRKILMTLLVEKLNIDEDEKTNPANKIADPLIDALFGSTGQQSNIWLTDGAGVDTTPIKQTFNAIDRFTGGVAPGALYTVEAASAARIECDLYQKHDFTDWQIGLLILLLRDAMEGDLSFGWGKSKGYGSIKLVEISDNQKTFTEWEALYRQNDKPMQDYVHALNNHLDKQLSGEN
jgi:CRISPR/Cas system CSM-associated protein Csm3 (group 7 of RAMP superfamily)